MIDRVIKDKELFKIQYFICMEMEFLVICKKCISVKVHGIGIKDKDNGNRKLVIKIMNGVMSKINLFVNRMVLY
jgi:hypothetical protein